MRSRGLVEHSKRSSELRREGKGYAQDNNDDLGMKRTGLNDDRDIHDKRNEDTLRQYMTIGDFK